MRPQWLSNAVGPMLGGVTVVAVGVGLGAMVFALADPALRALPYNAADRLVSIGFGLPIPGRPVNPADVPSIASWQARTDLFEGLAAFIDRGWIRVRSGDRVVPLRTVAATDNLLDVLGLGPRIAAVDSASAWISRHAAATSGGELQPGRSVRILPSGRLTVDAILPDSFLLPQADRTQPVDALTVLPPGPVITIESHSSFAPTLVGRLRPTVTPGAAETSLNVTMERVGRRVSVVPLVLAMNARLRGLATGALMASGLIVFVCWTNVFSMALTRGLYRAPEIATRTALGATPSRIVGLLALDALKLVLLGSVAAFVVACLAFTAVLPALPPRFATVGVPSITGRVAVFLVLASSFAGASWYVASLLAWRLSARTVGLNAISRDGRTIRVLRFASTAGQLGAASLLLTGSALLGRSYINLMHVDPGLDERIQTLTVAHDPNIPTAGRRDIVDRTLTAFRKEPGVVAAAATAGRMLDGRANLSAVVITDGHVFSPDWTAFVGDYFAVMGLRFVNGGAPEVGDEKAAVISQSAAQEFFGRRPPVGELLSPREFRVVGVVRDSRSRSLSVAPKPEIFVQAGGWNGDEPQTTYVLRVTDASGLTSWERVVRSVDPLAVFLDNGSIGTLLNRSIRDRTFATIVISLFALASVLVASLGIAGVVAYTVVKRTREMAIRSVLGASQRSITTLVIRDAVTAAVCGLLAGVLVSVWLSHALESLLYGVAPADPITLFLTAVFLIVAVLAAATLPGVRAGRIAPATALRSD